VARKRHPEVEAIADEIGALGLPEAQRRRIERRYLYYAQWLEDAATRTRQGHYALRIVAGVGSALVAGMSAADAFANAATAVSWITFAVGLGVAVALFVDGFLNLGERWPHYRRAAERLKGLGWRFIQLCEPFQASSHADVVDDFNAKVEDVIDAEVEVYVSGPARPAAP
jgi:Protein of unknown function (DUF4231)